MARKPTSGASRGDVVAFPGAALPALVRTTDDDAGNGGEHVTRRLTDPQDIAFIEAIRALPPDALPAVTVFMRDLAMGKDPWHAAYRFGIARGDSPADACSAAERACAGSCPRPSRWPPFGNA